MAMTSSVPYLLRAINEWILDNGFTPYLVIDAAVNDTSVPMEYVKDGQIVLNISSAAIRDLVIGADQVAGSGGLGGGPHEICARLPAVGGRVTNYGMTAHVSRGVPSFAGLSC